MYSALMCVSLCTDVHVNLYRCDLVIISPMVGALCWILRLLHFGGDRPRGLSRGADRPRDPARGAENVPWGRYCVRLALINFFTTLCSEKNSHFCFLA